MGAVAAMSTTTCAYHCRACGSHFTSLRAFDAHRSGLDERQCWAEGDPPLVDRVGKCEISSFAHPLGRVLLHEHVAAEDYRRYRQMAERRLKRTGQA